MSIRAALDLRSPPHNKKCSICDSVTLRLRNRKIAGTVHKSPLTPETVQLLFEKGELTSAETSDPFDANSLVLHFSVPWQTRPRKSKGNEENDAPSLCNWRWRGILRA